MNKGDLCQKVSHHLQVRHAHVEVLVHVCMPNDADIGEVESAQVSLEYDKTRSY